MDPGDAVAAATAVQEAEDGEAENGQEDLPLV
jgi:hypothetical protein